VKYTRSRQITIGQDSSRQHRIVICKKTEIHVPYLLSNYFSTSGNTHVYLTNHYLYVPLVQVSVILTHIVLKELKEDVDSHFT